MTSSDTSTKVCETIFHEETLVTTKSPSIIRNIVPSVVRSRLPTLSSFRQSVCSTFVDSHSRTRSMPEFRNMEYDATKRDSETNRYSPSESTSSSRSVSPDISKATGELSISGSRLVDDLPINEERRTGVDRILVEHGLRLGLDAYARMKNDVTADEATVRALHLDSTRYMIRALPTDLAPWEMDLLRETISDTISKQTSKPSSGNHTVRPVRGRNILRNATDRLVCMIIALVFFLIPVSMTLLNSALKFERKHQLSESVARTCKVLLQGGTTASLEVASNLTKLIDSQYGQKCCAVVIWVAQSIMEGAHDGLLRSSNGNVRLLEARRSEAD